MDGEGRSSASWYPVACERVALTKRTTTAIVEEEFGHRVDLSTP